MGAETRTSGNLFTVATPIGNLEDITLRALRVLKEVDLICAEDTRRTRKLLTHYGISTPLVSYHAHNQASRGPELVQRLIAGQAIALVSDAGTPGFSDPGADLVARAWDAGVQVEAVPGPAAGVAALSMSGFKGDVTFVGFLPRGEGKRQKMLEGLAKEPRVLIIYESPKRVARTLKEMAACAQGLGNRQVLVVRELTKKFEQHWRGPVAEVAARLLQDCQHPVPGLQADDGHRLPVGAGEADGLGVLQDGGDHPPLGFGFHQHQGAALHLHLAHHRGRGAALIIDDEHLVPGL